MPTRMLLALRVTTNVCNGSERAPSMRDRPDFTEDTPLLGSRAAHRLPKLLHVPSRRRVHFLHVCHSVRQEQKWARRANTRNLPIFGANARNLGAEANVRNFGALQIHTTPHGDTTARTGPTHLVQRSVGEEQPVLTADASKKGFQGLNALLRLHNIN